MSYIKWLSLFTIIVITLSISQSRDSTSVTIKPAELYNTMETIGNEYIAVLQVYQLTYGRFPETQSAFDEFVDKNTLDVDRTYWNNCSYKLTGETAEILIKIDDAHRIPRMLNSKFRIEYARGVLYVSSFLNGSKSTLVSVSGEILTASVIIEKVLTKVDPYYQDGKYIMRRLTESNYKRITHQK